MPRDKITIAGSGLVGSLAAIFLAKRGYEVQVLERRPDMRREAIAAGRSINLALSTRGLHALQQVGMDSEILSLTIPMRGRCVHAIDGTQTLQPYGRNDSECIYSVSRGGLNRALMTHAERTERVRIEFNSTFSGRIEDSPTELLLGADGAFSLTREAVLAVHGARGDVSELSHGYKELTLPPDRSGGHQLDKNALHIWPRKEFMLIALPNLDGSFTCTLFLQHRGAVSFEQLGTPAQVDAFFAEHFADARARMPKLSDEFFANPTGTMVTVKAPVWSAHRGGKQALLIGDAAHGIVPFFGQGMNCGFEDCTILDALLERAGREPDWKRIADEFFQSRKPNTDAIADMAVENFVEMRDKVADPRFLFEKDVEKLLMKEFPGEYVNRYGLVSFSRTPYRLAYELGRAQSALLARLCKGLTDPSAVDRQLAAQEIRQKIVPLMKEKDSWI